MYTHTHMLDTHTLGCIHPSSNSQPLLAAKGAGHGSKNAGSLFAQFICHETSKVSFFNRSQLI